MFFVYMLRSEKNGYRYIGQTNNLEKRIMEHNSGLTSSIKFQIPFKIEYFETYQTRKEAIQKEKFLNPVKDGSG